MLYFPMETKTKKQKNKQCSTEVSQADKQLGKLTIYEILHSNFSFRLSKDKDHVHCTWVPSSCLLCGQNS